MNGYIFLYAARLQTGDEMRLGIMQPYFFPYLGYFSLIAATDHFVIFDPVQYIRHGWINRNRILKPNGNESQYINVPLVKHQRETLIRDVKIANNIDWKSRIIGQIQHYRNQPLIRYESFSIRFRTLDLSFIQG